VDIYVLCAVVDGYVEDDRRQRVSSTAERVFGDSDVMQIYKELRQARRYRSALAIS
jgi:hypothetical protein